MGSPFLNQESLHVSDAESVVVVLCVLCAGRFVDRCSGQVNTRRVDRGGWFSTTTNGAGGTYSTAASPPSIYGQNPTSGVTGFGGAWSDATPAPTSQFRMRTTDLSHPLAIGNATGSVYNFANNSNSRGVTRILSAYNQALPEYYASSLLWAGVIPVSSGAIRTGLGQNTPSNPGTTGAILEWGYQNSDIRLWVNGAATTVLSGFTASETYLMTIGVQVNGGGNEIVNATLYDSAGGIVGAALVNTEDFSIADLDYWRMTETSTLGYASESVSPVFDNFRYGTTLGDVMFVAPPEPAPIPEPASLVLLALGAVCLFRRRMAPKREE